MTNEKMEQIVKLLKDSGEDYILCYPIKIGGEDCCRVSSRSANITRIEMLEHILDFIIETGKNNGITEDTATVFWHKMLNERINYAYRVG